MLANRTLQTKDWIEEVFGVERCVRVSKLVGIILDTWLLPNTTNVLTTVINPHSFNCDVFSGKEEEALPFFTYVWLCGLNLAQVVSKASHSMYNFPNSFFHVSYDSLN